MSQELEHIADQINTCRLMLAGAAWRRGDNPRTGWAVMRIQRALRELELAHEILREKER